MYKIFFIQFQFILTFLQNAISYISGGSECLCCSNKTYALPICNRCKRFYKTSVDNLFDNRCKICGKALVSEKETCLLCRNEKKFLSVDRVFPLFSYRLWNKNLLFEWKMESIRTLSFFFAFLMHKAIVQIEKFYGVLSIPIVPVPPRPGKIQETGWDQIDDLCRFLASKYNHTVLPILSRNSKEQQKKRDRLERREKILNDYSLCSKVSLTKVLKGCVPELVILLDDVLTTGATVERCSSELKKLGVKKVFVLTIFIVD